MLAILPHASMAASMALPPGPSDIPMLGSYSFFFDKYVMKTPTAELLLGYRNKYGPLFSFKTGPIRHVWASGKIADELLARPEAAGRPGRDDHPFAQDEFLFNIIDPERAMPIRKKQHAWLQEHASRDKVAQAVKDAGGGFREAIESAPARSLLHAEDQARDTKQAAGTPKNSVARAWPAKPLSRVLLSVMLTVFTGEPSASLNDGEMGKLLWALNGFRERPIPDSDGPSGLFKPSVPKDDYGGAVRYFLSIALQRSGRGPEELPLLVAACVGGGEILPLIFQWIVSPKQRCFFSPTHPFLPYVAPHFSHISHFNLVFAAHLPMDRESK